MDRPGRFFTWAELGAESAPDDARARLVGLCVVLDAIRREVGPLRVTSGWRSAEHNARIGGSRTSRHVTGEAADVALVSGHDARALAARIRALGLPVDQVIWYDRERGGHVHIGLAVAGEPRGQYLHAPAGGGYEVDRG